MNLEGTQSKANTPEKSELNDSWDLSKNTTYLEYLKNIPKYIKKISEINKEDFIKDFFEVKKVFYHLYNEQFSYKRPTKETSEQIEVLEKIIYEKIKEYNLPYIYELLMNKYTEIKKITPMIGNKRHEKSIVPFEMREPFRISDKFGKEFFVLSYNGEVKACPIEKQEAFVEYLGHAQMQGHACTQGKRKQNDR